MDGRGNQTPRGSGQRGGRGKRSRIVDSGVGTTLQIGNSNLMVTVDLPENTEVSDVPNVDLPDVTTDPQVTSHDYVPDDVEFKGKNAKAQFGNTNRAVLSRRADKAVRKTPSPATDAPPTTVEAVQATQDNNLYQAGIGANKSISLHDSAQQDTMSQQTFRKQVHGGQNRVSPKPPKDLNFPPDTRASMQDQPQRSARRSSRGVRSRDASVNTPVIYTRDKKVQTVAVSSEEDMLQGDEDIQFRELRGQCFTQIGQNNNIVDIQLTKEFLEVASQGGEVTVATEGAPLVKLTWSGGAATATEAEEKAAVRSSWTLKITEMIQNMQGEILRLMSNNMLASLRRLVKDIFGKYDARLLEVCNGSLVFVFWHRDNDAARRMINDKRGVKRIFHRLMEGVGKGDVDFTLEVTLLPYDSTAGDKHSRTGGITHDEPSRGHSDVETRLQSMESGLQHVQQDVKEQLTTTMQDMREMKELMLGMAHKIGVPKSEAGTKSELSSKYEASSVSLSPGDTGPTVSLKGAPVTYHPNDNTEYSIQKTALEEVGHPLEMEKSYFFSQDEKDNTSRAPGEDITGKPSGKQQPNLGYNATEYVLGETQEPKGAEGGAGFQPSKKAQPVGRTRSGKMFEEAERLLSSLNVASVGRSTTNREVKRLAEAVADALVDDDPPPPRAKTMDTLLCLDISESIESSGLDDVKRIAIDFVDRIQEIAEQYGLEENLGVIAMGGEARIVQQLTNDYGAVRDAIESLQSGGRTPIFEALTVCVAAIKGRGGVLSVGGAHSIRPRIIFVTDGLATNDAFETGPDTPSTDHNTKIQLIRLVSEFSPSEQSSTPNPIIWVPVGNADRSFLGSLAKLGGGNMIEGKDITTQCSYYRIQENIGKIYICVKNHKGDWDNLPEAIEAVANALVGDLRPEEKSEVIKAVQDKLENKEVKNPDSDPNHYDFINEVKDLPPVGSRVIRGPDWKYDEQNSGGPGTVVNHAKGDHLLWVLWDFNSTVCRYRFGLGGKYDVLTVDDQPRILLQDELIEIGVKVKRGADWAYGERDGGAGSIGVVVRKRRDGKVKVRWPDGSFKSCRFGYDGKFDIKVCSIDELIPGFLEQAAGGATPTSPQQASEKGGHEKPTERKPHVVWQWKDDLSQWRLYDPRHIEKLNKEFDRRPTGSCLLLKRGKNHRVMFRDPMSEKCVEDSVRRDVKRIVVSNEDRDALICMEISLNDESPWAKYTVTD